MVKFLPTWRHWSVRQPRVSVAGAIVGGGDVGDSSTDGGGLRSHGPDLDNLKFVARAREKPILRRQVHLPLVLRSENFSLGQFVVAPQLFHSITLHQQSKHRELV